MADNGVLATTFDIDGFGATVDLISDPNVEQLLHINPKAVKAFFDSFPSKRPSHVTIYITTDAALVIDYKDVMFGCLQQITLTACPLLYRLHDAKPFCVYVKDLKRALNSDDTSDLIIKKYVNSEFTNGGLAIGRVGQHAKLCAAHPTPPTYPAKALKLTVTPYHTVDKSWAVKFHQFFTDKDMFVIQVSDYFPEEGITGINIPSRYLLEALAFITSLNRDFNYGYTHKTKSFMMGCGTYTCIMVPLINVD